MPIGKSIGRAGSNMKIAIVGYGKMGRLLYMRAREKGHEVAAIIDPNVQAPEVTSSLCDAESLSGAEVVIEFSTSEEILDRIDTYAQYRLPAVIATTGWYDRLEAARRKVNSKKSSLLWSGNFAIGVHVYMSIVKAAAGIMNRFPGYDPAVQEVFHAGKGDSPSGTALMLGNILLEELASKERLETGRLDRKRTDSEIHISSLRGGSYPGTHTVMFDSSVDTVEIIHRARSREGFADGALQAASWLLQAPAGFFSLDDMLAF